MANEVDDLRSALGLSRRGRSGGAASKLKELERSLGKVAKSGDKGALDRATSIAKRVGGGAGGAVLKALNTLDLGRAGVVSTLKETGDLLRGDGASLKDLIEQTRRHIGVGDFVDTGNIWVDRALGLVGDVGLDPLTYVTGGTFRAAQAGAKGVARVSTADAVRTALAQGDKALANRAASQGASAVAEDIGAQAGLRFKVPFTHVGETVIPGTEGAAKGIDRALLGARSAARSVPAVDRAVSKVLEKGSARVSGKLKRDPEKGAAAYALDDALRSLGGRRRGIQDDLARRVQSLVERHGDLDPDEITRAIESADFRAAASPEVRVAAQDFAAFYKRAAKTIKDVTGRKVDVLTDYSPHRISAAAREAYQGYAKRTGKPTLEFAREYKQGEEFLGTTLQQGTADEINRLFREQFDIDLFDTNAFGLADRYAREAAGFAERHGVGKYLSDRGVSVERKFEPNSNRSAQLEIADDLDEAAGVRAADASQIAEQIEQLRSVGLGSATRTQFSLTAADDAARRAAAAELSRVQIDDALRRLRGEYAEVDSGLVPIPEPPSGVALRGAEEEASQARQRIATGREMAADADSLRRRLAERMIEQQSPKLVAAEAKVAELRPQFEAAAAAYAAAAEQVAANVERMAGLEREIGKMSGRRARGAAEELRWRQSAQDAEAAAEQFAQQGHDDLAAAAKLQGEHARSVARAEELGQRALEVRTAAEDLPKWTRQTRDMVEMGLREIVNGGDHWAEDWIVEAVQSVERVMSDPGKLLRLYDHVMSRWKAYALLTPGTSFRNLFGGLFNNGLYGVDRKVYDAFPLDYLRYRRGGIGAVSEQWRDGWQVMTEHGVFDPTSVRDLADVTPDGRAVGAGLLGERLQRVDPTALGNVALATNAKVFRGVEDVLRGTLFLDAYRKSGSVEHALEMVERYHFNYERSLSTFERAVSRRAVPFYTWTRLNFPLQIEEMIRRPGNYTAYLHAKRNIEQGVPEDSVVPSYYDTLLAIRLPLTNAKGERQYATPDLPFRDLSEQFDLNKVIGQLSFAIKVPLEVAAGKQFYSEIPFRQFSDKAPAAWAPILPLLVAVDGKFGLPKVRRHKDGSYLISDKDAYKIEQALPLLGKLRRLVPNESRYQNRVMSTWLSFAFGIGMRTLDDPTKFGELSRRNEAVGRIVKDLKERGYQTK